MRQINKNDIDARLKRISDLLALMGEEDPLFLQTYEELVSLSNKLESWALDQF